MRQLKDVRKWEEGKMKNGKVGDSQFMICAITPHIPIFDLLEELYFM